MTLTPPEKRVYRIDTEPHLRILIPIVVAFALFMETLDSTIIATSLPQIARSLDESPLHLNIAVTSYLLSLAVFIPISGWIADRFGTRRVFCAAIMLFTLGSMLCGICTSLGQMVAARILQGFGGAMMTPVGRLIMLRSFPKDGLVTAMSYMTIPALIGPTLGPVIGGFLTTYLSWRWIFYVNVPIGLIGITLTLRYIEDFREAAPPSFDFRGFAILGTGLALLELCIDYLGRNLVSTGTEIGLFAAACVMLGWYGRHAGKIDNPALDLRLLRIRTFNISVLGGSICRTGLGGIPFLVSLQLQLGFGLSPMQAGGMTFLVGAGSLLMKTLAPRMLRFLGFRRLLLGNAALLTVLIAGFAGLTPASPHWFISLYLLIFGFIRSLQFTGLNVLAYADLGPSVMSRGTSLSSVAQQLTMSFGVGVCASLLAILVGPIRAVGPGDFALVFLAVSLLPLISCYSFAKLKPQDGEEVSGHHTPPTEGTLPAT